MSRRPVPRDIIGDAALRALLDAGFRVVPAVANRAMRRAAAEVMRSRRDRDGHWLPWVGHHEKAGIRYAAMLSAWKGDQG